MELLDHIIILFNFCGTSKEFVFCFVFLVLKIGFKALHTPTSALSLSNLSSPSKKFFEVMYYFTFLLVKYEVSSFSTSSLTLAVVDILYYNYPILHSLIKSQSTN
jgi:hypothetical protein